MDFGITFKGGVRPERARALVRQAENAGFTYCWFYDSHILWRESFVAIAMLMEHTTKMRFGPCVTNPNTRDWSLAASLFGSLALQSGGRFDLGVGRGDSAVRVMGKKPATLARLEEFVHVVKALVRGEEAQYEGCPERRPTSTMNTRNWSCSSPNPASANGLPIRRSRPAARQAAICPAIKSCPPHPLIPGRSRKGARGRNGFRPWSAIMWPTSWKNTAATPTSSRQPDLVYRKTPGLRLFQAWPKR